MEDLHILQIEMQIFSQTHLFFSLIILSDWVRGSPLETQCQDDDDEECFVRHVFDKIQNERGLQATTKLWDNQFNKLSTELNLIDQKLEKGINDTLQKFLRLQSTVEQKASLREIEKKVYAPCKLPQGGGCNAHHFRNFQTLFEEDRAVLFPAGVDPEVGITYACRGRHSNGDVIPGVLNLATLTCYVAQGNLEYGLRTGDVLIQPEGTNFTWVHGDGSSIPSNAITSGRTAEGETLFIAQGTVTGDNGKTSIVPGKVGESQPGSAFVSYDSKSYSVSNFSILVCS